MTVDRQVRAATLGVAVAVGIFDRHVVRHDHRKTAVGDPLQQLVVIAVEHGA